MNSVITNEDFLSEYPTYQNKGLNNITSGINSASITIDRITQGQALIKYNEELNTEENKYFIRQAYIYQTKVEIDRKYSTVGQTNYSFNGESASMSITQAEIDRMEQTVIQLLQNAGVLISNLTYGIDISKNEEVEQLPQEDDRYLTLLQDDPKYLKNVMPEDYDNKYIAYEKAPNEQFARAVYKDVPNPLGSNVVIKTLTFPVVNPISGNKWNNSQIQINVDENFNLDNATISNTRTSTDDFEISVNRYSLNNTEHSIILDVDYIGNGTELNILADIIYTKDNNDNVVRTVNNQRADENGNVMVEPIYFNNRVFTNSGIIRRITINNYIFYQKIIFEFEDMPTVVGTYDVEIMGMPDIDVGTVFTLYINDENRTIAGKMVVIYNGTATLFRLIITTGSSQYSLAILSQNWHLYN